MTIETRDLGNFTSALLGMFDPVLTKAGRGHVGGHEGVGRLAAVELAGILARGLLFKMNTSKQRRRQKTLPHQGLVGTARPSSTFPRPSAVKFGVPIGVSRSVPRIPVLDLSN
jgi:hypothetical protein